MVPATRFTDPIAVEAWDTWFRWREGDVLRDITIDDTWWRVAGAVSDADGAMAPLWAHHYVDAFSRWRLLPDERLLRWAGTGHSLGPFDAPGAVLNVAAFITVPLGAEPRFDRAGFVQTAALAIRLLDDALLTCDATPEPAGLQVGIIGFGDALRRLGSPYAGLEARAYAHAIAAALAEGCLQGAVDLAEERGCSHDTDPASLVAWHKRGMPPSLLERASRFGLRHSQLTAIERHPMLARLANNTTDGLDPMPPFAAAPRDAAEVDTAQRDIRAAMQPWIDQPIDFQNPASTHSHAGLLVTGAAAI